MTKYSRIIYTERQKIELLRNEGKGVRAIARVLCRSVSSISDELKRCKNKYSAKQADKDAQQQRSYRVKNRKIQGALEEIIYFCMMEVRMSPEQISRRLKKKYPDVPEFEISPEAIYLWVYRHKERKMLTSYLRRKRRYRHSRKSQRISRGGIKNRVSISKRSSSVENREEPGHWEGDLIIGKNNQSAVLTLVERSSRFTILVQVDNRKSKTVVEKIIHFLKQLPPHLRKSLTYDNGSEMALHEWILKSIQTYVYFANPRSPWERGTNENTNGLVREFLPKGIDLSGFSQLQLGSMAALLNRRPRKIIEFNTPEEVFQYFHENPEGILSKSLKELELCCV